MVFDNLGKLLSFDFAHFKVLRGSIDLSSNCLIRWDNRLLSSVNDLNNLVRCVLRPDISLFVMKEVIHKQHMSEVYKAISFTGQ